MVVSRKGAYTCGRRPPSFKSGFQADRRRRWHRTSRGLVFRRAVAAGVALNKRDVVLVAEGLGRTPSRVGQHVGGAPTKFHPGDSGPEMIVTDSERGSQRAAFISEEAYVDAALDSNAGGRSSTDERADEAYQNDHLVFTGTTQASPRSSSSSSRRNREPGEQKPQKARLVRRSRPESLPQHQIAEERDDRVSSGSTALSLSGNNVGTSESRSRRLGSARVHAAINKKSFAGIEAHSGVSKNRIVNGLSNLGAEVLPDDDGQFSLSDITVQHVVSYGLVLLGFLIGSYYYSRLARILGAHIAGPLIEEKQRPPPQGKVPRPSSRQPPPPPSSSAVPAAHRSAGSTEKRPSATKANESEKGAAAGSGGAAVSTRYGEASSTSSDAKRVAPPPSTSSATAEGKKPAKAEGEASAEEAPKSEAGSSNTASAGKGADSTESAGKGENLASMAGAASAADSMASGAAAGSMALGAAAGSIAPGAAAGSMAGPGAAAVESVGPDGAYEENTGSIAAAAGQESMAGGQAAESLGADAYGSLEN